MSKEYEIDNEVPLHIPGFPVSELKLTAEEGYVWSRIDGVSTVDQLCLMTGLGREKTLEIITRLHDLEVIKIPGRTSSKKPVSKSASNGAKEISSRSYATTSSNKDTVGADKRSGMQSDGKSSARIRTLSSRREKDEDEDTELSEEKRKDIEEYYACLDEISFYQALGIPRDSGNKEILRAYKKKSLQFHPDRHYGKRLGRYKVMLEEIFKYITQVKDFLLDPEKRKHYDESLLDIAEIKRQAEDAQRAEEDELKSSEGFQEISVRLDGEAGGGSMNGQGAERVSQKTRKKSAGTYTRKRSRLRIQALANQFAGFSRPDEAAEPASSESPSPRARRSDTMRSLSLVLGKAVDERKNKGKKHYEEGVKKLLDGNFIGASTSLKLATVFEPENEEYGKKYKVAASRAGEIIADQQYKQAKFHLSVGRWEAAAKLMVQAADHHPVTTYQMEAAEVLKKTGELRRAQHYAIKAVESSPENVQARVVLASVYKDAKMYRNARREIEIALKLDPDNGEARGLFREIRKCV